MRMLTTSLIQIVFLMQSCVVYQKTPVSLEEVVDKGNVKVEKSGEKMYFRNIILDEGSYFGVTSTYNMLVDSSVSVYPKDIETSRNLTIIGVLIFPVVLIAILVIATGEAFGY